MNYIHITRVTTNVNYRQQPSLEKKLGLLIEIFRKFR